MTSLTATTRAPSARHIETLCLQTRRMRAITRLTTAAGADLDRLFHAICAEIPSLFDADAAALLVDDGEGLLRVRAGAGISRAYLDAVSLPLATARRETLEGADVMRLSRASTGPRTVLLGGEMTAALAVPIRCRDEIAGLLVIGARASESGFTDDDALFAEVLAVLLGARLVELMLQRSVDRLRRARRDSARMAAVVDGAVPDVRPL